MAGLWHNLDTDCNGFVGLITRLQEHTGNSPGRTQDDTVQTLPGFQNLDWLMTDPVPADAIPHNYDWLFSENSLQDLYSMAYMDNELSMTGFGVQ